MEAGERAVAHERGEAGFDTAAGRFVKNGLFWTGFTARQGLITRHDNRREPEKIIETAGRREKYRGCLKMEKVKLEFTKEEFRVVQQAAASRGQTVEEYCLDVLEKDLATKELAGLGGKNHG